jgi:hypothetical protein
MAAARKFAPEVELFQQHSARNHFDRPRQLSLGSHQTYARLDCGGFRPPSSRLDWKFRKTAALAAGRENRMKIASLMPTPAAKW